MTQARLRALEGRVQRLAAELADTGFISSGSLIQRWVPCGRPGCRCQADPPRLHGPYWQWTGRGEGQSTRTLRLDDRQAAIYREWIARRRRLDRTVADMEAVSRQAAELLLSEPQAGPPDPASGRPALGRLARLVVEISESMEPLLEAAQAWADARDDEDRETQAQSREDLRQALIESPALADRLSRLSRLSRLINQHRAASNSD